MSVIILIPKQTNPEIYQHSTSYHPINLSPYALMAFAYEYIAFDI